MITTLLAVVTMRRAMLPSNLSLLAANANFVKLRERGEIFRFLAVCLPAENIIRPCRVIVVVARMVLHAG